ncbi:HEAT repeat domain-containing protein, partial [Nocardia flavorosea]|uniref:HEAT repeat domain-containing protein n=1 Tax=Nocardia flavorosea TaxID=53429 RepID=UPI002456D540
PGTEPGRAAPRGGEDVHEITQWGPGGPAATGRPRGEGPHHERCGGHRGHARPPPAGPAARLGSGDPVVRAAVVDLLRALRAGVVADYRAALADPDHRVRIEGVRALVSLDERDAIAAAATDPNREVRIVAAQGLATIGNGGAEIVRALSGDSDPLVRAAALAAFAGTGATPADIDTCIDALRDTAWQVRVGAARGLAAADPGSATSALTGALADPHLDVRKAAVLTLATWPGFEPARLALQGAVDDTDADVRAYARRALMA